MGSIIRQLIGEIDPSLKGKAYEKAMAEKLSPESIAKAKPQTQKVKTK